MSFGPLIPPESLIATTDPIRLLDARPGAEVYASGHLAGALHADLNVRLSSASEPTFDPAKGGRHPLPALARWAGQLGAWGIGPDTRVVAYDGAAGGNGACRLWWMLRAVGHAHVAVLDGGVQAATAAGLALTRAETPPVPALAPYPGDGWQRPTVHLDPVAGRIPGSLNLPFSENLSPAGRYKTREALRQLYLEFLGGTGPEHLVVHCGSGVTACHTLLALELAGLGGSALYVGSYSEWCRSGKPLGRGP